MNTAETRYVGVFEREDDLVGATRAARAAGLRIVDAYTPYAVHGLDAAMGLRPSRLALVCLVAGATGAVLKLWFELWTAVVDWPLDVGGKPHNSLPAFVPITFEVMVLFAGLATVSALFLVAGLRPGRRPALVADQVTDDRFALVVEPADATASLASVRALFDAHHAVDVRARVEPAEEAS
ncbi:MAG: DUF3341 domain-containing protein [Vicinamibacteraceae bacterium]|nr:DUF3341 domain-containing protein [Vicinamibacteraceae bacterium]